MPFKAENWHAFSQYEQYFSTHCFLDICLWVFNVFFTFGFCYYSGYRFFKTHIHKFLDLNLPLSLNILLLKDNILV